MIFILRLQIELNNTFEVQERDSVNISSDVNHKTDFEKTQTHIHNKSTRRNDRIEQTRDLEGQKWLAYLMLLIFLFITYDYCCLIVLFFTSSSTWNYKNIDSNKWRSSERWREGRENSVVLDNTVATTTNTSRGTAVVATLFAVQTVMFMGDSQYQIIKSNLCSLFSLALYIYIWCSPLCVCVRVLYLRWIRTITSTTNIRNNIQI